MFSEAIDEVDDGSCERPHPLKAQLITWRAGVPFSRPNAGASRRRSCGLRRVLSPYTLTLGFARVLHLHAANLVCKPRGMASLVQSADAGQFISRARRIPAMRRARACFSKSRG